MWEREALCEAKRRKEAKGRAKGEEKKTGDGDREDTAEITDLHATLLFSWHRRKSYTVDSHNEPTGPSLKSRASKTNQASTWLLAAVAPQRKAPCWTCSSSVSTFINNSPSTLGQESHRVYSYSPPSFSALFYCPAICIIETRCARLHKRAPRGAGQQRRHLRWGI